MRKFFKNNKRMVMIAACICIIAAIAGVLTGCLFKKSDKDNTPAEDKVIYECDFNQTQGGLVTDAYDARGGVTVFTYEEAGGMDDSRCLSIQNISQNDARYVLKVDDARKNTYYRVSVWIKTENVSEEDGTIGANISVLNTSYRSYTYSGNQDWTLLEFFGQTGKEQTSFDLCLRLGFYSGINTGKVWFDDLCVEQLSELPKGVIAYSMEDTMSAIKQEQQKDRFKNEKHDDTLAAGFIIIVITIAVFVICMMYARNRDKGVLVRPQESNTNIIWSVIILILIGFIVRLIGSVTLPQCDIDVNLFKYWGVKVAEYGPTELYKHAESINLDYPPLLMYWLWFVGKFCSIFKVGTASAICTVLIKLPSMLADCAIAFVIYAWCKNLRNANKNWTLIAVSLWLFNPIVILDSTAWGQVDTLLSMFIVGAVYWISQNRYIPASIALAFAVALKPQGIMMIPIIGYALFKILVSSRSGMKISRRIMLIVKSIAAFSAVFLAIMLPFGIKMEPNIFVWIYDLYIGTVDGYEYASVNAFNAFYILGKNWVSDSQVVLPIGNLGITWNHLGMLAIVEAAILAWVLYMFADTKKKPYLVWLISATLLYNVVTFGPRMHERYFFPVIILLLFAVVLSNNKLLLALFGVTTLSNFFTVLEVMTGLTVGGELRETDYEAMAYYYWNHLNPERLLMAWGNVLTCIALTAITVLMVFNVIKTDNEKSKIWKESIIDERRRVK